jgi:hypothetical protein
VTAPTLAVLTDTDRAELLARIARITGPDGVRLDTPDPDDTLHTCWRLGLTEPGNKLWRLTDAGEDDLARLLRRCCVICGVRSLWAECRVCVLVADVAYERWCDR